jgi:hypothetical protein
LPAVNTNAASISGGAGAAFMINDSTAIYVFVGNETAKTIGEFSVKLDTGVLTATSNTPSTSTVPTSMFSTR